MPHDIHVVLDDHEAEFVYRVVTSGRFGSASEAVQHGLRLVERNERQIEVLRAALIEGENSGEAVAWDIEAFIARKRAEWQG